MAAVSPPRRSFRIKPRTVGHYAFLFLLSFIILLPIYVIVLTSLKKQVVVMSREPVWLFELFSEQYRDVMLVGDDGETSWVNLFSNYQTIFAEQNFMRHLVSSVYVALSSTVLTILVSSYCAYAIARMRFVGRGVMANTTLLIRMVPPVVLTVPIFGLWRAWEARWEASSGHSAYTSWIANSPLCSAEGDFLDAMCQIFIDGMTDGRLGLILFYTALNLPFVVWLLVGFIQQIPTELEEAAIVDGASQFQVFRRIISPLLRGGYAVAAIFVFRIAWNEFILGLILTGRRTYTLPVKTTLFIDQAGVRWGEIMAMGTLILIPPLLLTFFSARQIIQGMTAGAVKG